MESAHGADQRNGSAIRYRADELEIGGHADVKLADHEEFLAGTVVSINRGRRHEPRAGLPAGARRSAESAVVLIAPEMPFDGVDIGLPAKVRLSSNRRSVLMGFFDRAFAAAVDWGVIRSSLLRKEDLRSSATQAFAA